jgi:hypothetical protein
MLSAGTHISWEKRSPSDILSPKRVNCVPHRGTDEPLACGRIAWEDACYEPHVLVVIGPRIQCLDGVLHHKSALSSYENEKQASPTSAQCSRSKRSVFGDTPEIHFIRKKKTFVEGSCKDESEASPCSPEG